MQKANGIHSNDLKPTTVLKWGKEKESVAKMDYISKMKELGHKDITVQPSGLTLTPECVFLGATADGIVSIHR